MTCDEARKTMSEISPRDATNALLAAVAQHVTRCPACAKWQDDAEKEFRKNHYISPLEDLALDIEAAIRVAKVMQDPECRPS